MAARLATKAEVLELAPGLTDDALLEELIEVAGTMINLGVWGAKASKGHAALAAHLASTVQSAGSSPTAGPIASRSIGALSVSYAGQPPSDPELGNSKYGQLYLILRRSLLIVPFVGRP